MYGLAGNDILQGDDDHFSKSLQKALQQPAVCLAWSYRPTAPRKRKPLFCRGLQQSVMWCQ